MKDSTKTEIEAVAGRPKVLYLITKSNWGGAQRYVFNMATDARNSGWDVAVAAGGDGRLIDELRASNIRVIPIHHLTRDIGIKADLTSFKNIWRIVESERPDVLHVNSSKAGGIGTLIGRLLRVPAVIFTAHGWDFNNPHRNAWQQVIIRFLHLLTVFFSHKTIAVAETLVNQLGWPKFIQRRFVVIRNGVESVTLFTRSVAKAAIADSSPAASKIFAWAERENAFVLVALSELHRIKGLDTLIEAIVLLRQRYPELPVATIIGGDGEERANLEKLINDHSLNNQVALIGQISDASRRLSAFDCLVMPSRSEAMPMAILEAGLAELPVIASRVGGIPEVIEQRISGILVSPDRPRELAEAIRFLASNRGEATKLGKALHQVVRKNHSRNEAVFHTLEVYRQELLRRKRG